MTRDDNDLISLSSNSSDEDSRGYLAPLKRKKTATITRAEQQQTPAKTSKYKHISKSISTATPGLTSTSTSTSTSKSLHKNDKNDKILKDEKKKGWIKKLSRSKGIHYWYNQSTGETTWNNPTKNTTSHTTPSPNNTSGCTYTSISTHAHTHANSSSILDSNSQLARRTRLALAYKEMFCDPEGAAKIKKIQIKERKKHCSKFYVFIKPEDVPLAPGPAPSTHEEETEAEQTTTEKEKDDLLKIKSRIKKMLDLGLHPGTSDAESLQSMRVAQKLLTKFNLKQVDILNHTGDNNNETNRKKGADNNLRGGTVHVELRKRVDGEANIDTPLPETWSHEAKIARKSPQMSWIIDLARPVCTNFDVKYYTSTSSLRNEVVFYGVYTNVQLAAYAFKVAVEKISIQMAKYKPDMRKYSSNDTLCSSKAGWVKACKNSYADGVVSGLNESVNKAKSEELSRREAKLRRAQQRSNQRNSGNGSGSGDSKAAYESDQEDSDSDSDSDSDNGSNDEGGSQSRARLKRAKLDLNTCRIKLEKLQQEEASHSQLAVYTEDVCANLLEGLGIKLSKSRARQSRIECNGAAFTQGKIDSKKINLEEQAIH